jgi:hypothetical protein
MSLKITGLIFITLLTLFVITTAPAILMLNKVFATGIFNKDNNVHIHGGKNIGNIFSNLFGIPSSSNTPSSESSEKYTPHHHK